MSKNNSEVWIEQKWSVILKKPFTQKWKSHINVKLCEMWKMKLLKNFYLLITTKLQQQQQKKMDWKVQASKRCKKDDILYVKSSEVIG